MDHYHGSLILILFLPSVVPIEKAFCMQYDDNTAGIIRSFIALPPL